MARNWIGIASAKHVARGRKDGFMQVCHGKGGPLRRIAAGDRVTYYSPGHIFGGPMTPSNRCQSFTALGTTRDDRVYQFDMGGGFIPYRLDVDWLEARPASICRCWRHWNSRAARRTGAMPSASACWKSPMRTWM